MEREYDGQTESGLQENNLGPVGMGQPKKKKKKRPIDPRIVMPQYEEEDSRYNRFNQPGQGQMPGPVGVPRPQAMPKREGMDGGQYAGGRWDPQQPPGQPPVQPPIQGGLYDAFKQSVANNYTDIQDTNPWQTGQHMGQLQGFNTNGWGTGERGSGTLKNRFGQIASNYDVTQPGALKQLMQDPRFLEMTGGKATIVDHPNQDLIDFDGPDGPMEPIDVIGSAVAGGSGQNWWWGPTGRQGGGPQAPANQIYNQAIPGAEQMPQGGLEGFDPQQQQGQAMEFLRWLLQQQEQGNMVNGGLGQAPGF